MQLLMYMIILIKKLSSSKFRVGVDAIVGLLIFRRSSFTIYIISENYTVSSKSRTLEMPRRTGYFRRVFEGRPVSLHTVCSQAAVRTREGETDCFEVKCGFRQGCVLSPLLFIIFMDNIMKRANQEENSIEELMFADDLVLIAEDQSRLQEMVSTLDQQCKNYGMRI